MKFKELKGWGEKQPPITMFLQRKEKHEKLQKHCFWRGGGGGGELFADLGFLRGVSEPNPQEKRGITLYLKPVSRN
jgi:hypothetical protein